MFKKKNTQLFTLTEITQVFADFSQSALFSEDGYSTQWLWSQYNLLQHFLLKEKSISLEKIEKILNLQEVGNFPLLISQEYEWLKKEREDNPIVLTFIPILVTMLSEKNKSTSYKLELLDYIKSFGNIFTLGIFAGLAFYVSFFNSFFISLPIFLAGYWLIKKVYRKVKSAKKEKAIEQTIKNIDKVKTSKYDELLSLFAHQNYTDLNNKILNQLELLKKQSIRIAKSIKPLDIPIWIDVEKMWTQHIPSLMNEYKESPESEDLIFKTLQAMEYVQEKHLESIVWENNLKISAKEKYWLSKANREISLEY